MRKKIEWDGIEFSYTIDENAVVRNRHGSIMKPTDRKTRVTIALNKTVRNGRQSVNISKHVSLSNLVVKYFRPDLLGCRVGYKNGNYKNCKPDNLCKLEYVEDLVRKLKATGLINDSAIARAVKLTRSRVSQILKSPS